MIAIIAKWIPQFGKTEDSAKNIDSQWLLMEIVTRNDFFNNIEEVNNTLNFYKRNYKGDKKYVKLSLIKEPIQLKTKEIVAIDNTYNIRLIQKLWRNKNIL
jgi:hypothetical protein